MKKQWITVFVGLLITAALSAQTLDERIKDAVNGLAQVTRMEVVIYPPVIQGTGSPSELSRYLHQKIDTYALISRRFNVVQPTRGGDQGRIEGSYIVAENDIVTVTLKLTSDSNVVIVAREFDIPLAELEKLELAWLPPGVQTQEEVKEREEIFVQPPSPASSPAPSPPPFTLTARPNSVTRTYYDGEELFVTVWADKDCYFKVYHIDVDGKMKMIYPNEYNRNNFLRANTEMTVPRDEVRFVLHEPFGQETILVTASPEQFTNLDSEMTPVTATRETVTRVSRGGSLVLNRQNTSAVTVSERFTFIILPASFADEVFTYKKPTDMAGAIQSLRSEITGKGGQFNGDEQEGVFSGNDFEGSYRISGGDIIVTLRYQRNAQTEPSTRGASGYNFSFAKPGNITQAVNTVRSGITGKGGSFNGNESAGNFEASGIAGEYRVADRVNVTISAKPFIVPNSLIEREVKNFFGVR
jgi:hypothetical protein